MTNINPKFHRVERVHKTVEIGARPPLIIGKPEPNRRIRISRKIDGALLMEVSGYPNMTLLPEQAFKLAAGIFKGLGIEVEYEWDGMRK
jgi:hypothetical protein